MSETTRAAAPSARRDLAVALRTRRYRQLLGTRLSSQSGDGFFQAGLASLVLFNPEQQATPLLVAGALTVAVLPFTIIGPFAGVLLDRWRRQRLLVVANVVRGVLAAACAALALVAGADALSGGWAAALYVLVLAALTVNRFLLAGLGASLPHTVDAGVLVTANAVTPTAGTGAFALGFAVGGGYRALVGAGSTTDATLLAAAVLAWLGSAALASRIPADALGPEDRTAGSMVAAARVAFVGLREGAAHVWSRPGPRNGLGAMAAHRFAFGVLTIVMIVLARGYLTEDVEDAFGVVVVTGAAVGVGALLAAVVTPVVVRPLGVHRWLTGCLGVAGLATAVGAVAMSTPVLVVMAFVVGLAGQAVKICVDTLVQTGVDDGVRGRAFSFYDVAYNAAFVAAAALAAVVVPPDGYARWLFAALGSWYVVASLAYAAAGRASRRA